jgi:Flp pilus assembly protein TadD
LKDSLNRLIRRWQNPQAPGRQDRIDPDAQKRLRSLGYVSESRPGSKKKQYTERDDLKTLLPLQSKLLDGVGLFQGGDLPGAEKAIREVLAASPTFILAYTHLASMYTEKGRIDQAVAILEQGLEKNPGDLLLLAKLGIILADSGSWRRAIPMLEHCALQMDFDPEIFNFLGIAHYHGGDFEKALQNYARALDLDHNNAPVYNNIGSVHLALFLRRREAGSFARAEESFKKALGIDPDLYSACNGLGAAYKNVGRNADAIAYWQRALRIKPDYDLPLVNLGITFLEEGQAGKALEYFLKYKYAVYHKIPPDQKQRIDRLIAEARAKIGPAG